jgi:surface carbohydrate biosynthesis protein
MLRNFFKRSLKQNYLCSLIEIIRPKNIVTFIDNSTDFFIIAKIFKDRNIKFIAIQNAHRYDIHSQNKNIYIPNYFVIGDHEVEVFKNNSKNISKIKSIGSLTATVAKRYFEKNNLQPKENLYDICLISEPRLGLNFDFKRIHQDYNVQECVGLIANHVLKFCEKYKKKFIISGKADIDSEKFKQAETMFYKNQIKNYNFDISFHKKSGFGNFKNIIHSKLIIGMCSTLLRNSFEFKRKILWCNFIDHKDTKSPSEGICTLRSKKFEDFENRVLEILKLDYEEYLSKIDNVDAFYNTKINALKYLRNEINL